MTQSKALKTAALVSITAAATTLLIQACGGGDAIAQALADPVEGVWEVAVTQRDCVSGATLSTFRSAQMFQRGGTFSDTSSHATSTRGPAYGLWTQGGSNYTVRFRFFRYNADGSFAGTSVSTMTVALATDGKTFTATRATSVFDPSGNAVASVCTSDAASRFS